MLYIVNRTAKLIFGAMFRVANLAHQLTLEARDEEIEQFRNRRVRQKSGKTVNNKHNVFHGRLIKKIVQCNSNVAKQFAANKSFEVELEKLQETLDEFKQGFKVEVQRLCTA